MVADLLGAFAGGFIDVFAWEPLGFMLVGILFGFVIGILPGLGGIVGIALILPFTFDLEITSAFALLLGTSVASQSSGDLTSILFGVPGEAASAAVLVDGHPMAKRGEAGRALAGSLLSSAVGALVGVLALLVAIPVVRPLVLSFASPEFFMFTVLALTFVAALSTGAVIKGLLAGLLGLLIAMVGLDPQAGVERYTFGQLHFWEGIGLVPAVVGLFAIPELYQLSISGSSISGRPYKRVSGVLLGLNDVIIHFWLVVRCSAIGTIVGVIPGLGTSVSQWVAYGHAVHSSPGKERFGKGAVEGMLGPSAANNSGLGGSLIPLVAFGVPGSLITAVLFGAFLIHGVVPGPSMLTTELQLTMSLVWIVILANPVVVAGSLLILNQLAMLTFIRGAIIIPVVTLLIYVGAFSSANTMVDVMVALGFGAVGLVMVALGWPRPPVILGLVLGGLTERYLFRSYSRYDLEFLTRPIVLVLLIIAIAVLFYPAARRAMTRWRQSPRVPVPAPPSDPGLAAHPAPDGQRPKRWDPTRIGDLVFSVALVLVGVAAVTAGAEWPEQTRLMPWVISFPLVALGGTYAFLLIVGRARNARGSMDLALQDVDPATVWRRSTLLLVWILTSLAAIWLFGFLYAGPLAILGYLAASGERWRVSIPIAVGVAILMWTLQQVLHLPLHRGLIPSLLGG